VISVGAMHVGIIVHTGFDYLKCHVHTRFGISPCARGDRICAQSSSTCKFNTCVLN
jgi:hypothetical protein